MVEINWTKQSIEDINNIATFISKDSLKYAKIQVERTFLRTEILHSHLEAGKIVPETNNKMIRELLAGYYRIVYKIIHCCPTKALKRLLEMGFIKVGSLILKINKTQYR